MAALRDLRPARVARDGTVLYATVLRRARHMETENARTRAAHDALADGGRRAKAG